MEHLLKPHAGSHTRVREGTSRRIMEHPFKKLPETLCTWRSFNGGAHHWKTWDSTASGSVFGKEHLMLHPSQAWGSSLLHFWNSQLGPKLPTLPEALSVTKRTTTKVILTTSVTSFNYCLVCFGRTHPNRNCLVICSADKFIRRSSANLPRNSLGWRRNNRSSRAWKQKCNPKRIAIGRNCSQKRRSTLYPDDSTVQKKSMFWPSSVETVILRYCPAVHVDKRRVNVEGQDSRKASPENVQASTGIGSGTFI